MICGCSDARGERVTFFVLTTYQKRERESISFIRNCSKRKHGSGIHGLRRFSEWKIHLCSLAWASLAWAMKEREGDVVLLQKFRSNTEAYNCKSSSATNLGLTPAPWYLLDARVTNTVEAHPREQDLATFARCKS